MTGMAFKLFEPYMTYLAKPLDTAAENFDITNTYEQKWL
jgi:hypothetical protein